MSASPRRVACALGEIASSNDPTSSSGIWIMASTDNSVERGAIALIASALAESHFATCSGFPTVAERPIF